MAVQPDYSFLWRPKWILSHIFVASCVIAFVLLGFWQLRRLDERKASNATIRAAEQAVPTPLATLLPAGSAADDADAKAVEYRSTTVTGTYAVDQQVLVQNRTNEMQPGYWVITPLRLPDGSAVAVNRGWVPFATTSHDGPWPDFDPPTGAVTVTGLVRTGEVRSGGIVAGPKDAAEGRLTTLARVDLGRLGQQVSEPLLPVYVALVTSDPAQAGLLPVPVPAPDLSEGPHLDYAGQWFAFATLTLIVYPLLLRRTARRVASEKAGDRTAEPDRAEDPDAVVDLTS